MSTCKNGGPSLCMWVIPKFPRKLKNTFAAFCRANDVFIRDRVEYLVSKDLRESGVDIAKMKSEETA